MKRSIVVCLFFFAVQISHAQEEKFKAVFMYNFTRYLDWPSEKKAGDFIIGVFGSSPIIDELNIIAQKRKVGVQKIVVKEIENPEDFKYCNIVYLPENNSSEISSVSQSCSAQGVVLITNQKGLAQTYSCINYVKIDGKQNFEINKTRLEKQGIKVNSALLSLGVQVD